MSGVERKGEQAAKSGMGPVKETPTAGQVDFRTQTVTRSKGREEKTEQLAVWEEAMVAGELRQACEELWQGVVPKACEAEFSLLPPGVAFTRGPRWKGKRAAVGRASGMEITGSLPQPFGRKPEREVRWNGDAGSRTGAANRPSFWSRIQSILDNSPTPAAQP